LEASNLRFPVSPLENEIFDKFQISPLKNGIFDKFHKR